MRPAALLDDALAIVDNTMRSAMGAAHTPGAVWGVVAGGELVHVGAYGTLTVGDDARPPTAGSLFRIASMTKSFTAAAVMALRDDGVIRLDEPIATYVPELAGLRGPTLDSPPVTVRHLLSMGAGLATDDAWADRHLDASRAEMDRFFTAGATFAGAPGTEFEYSNFGYAMVGRAIANVCGQPCQQVISERLIEPLGLVDTVWSPAAHHTDIATGYHVVDNDWVPDGVPLGDGELAPMGGLWSTIADIARWIAFFCDAFPPRDDPDSGPLRRSSRREMQQVWRAEPIADSVSAVDGAGPASPTGYGAGLRRLDQPGLGPVVSHSGGLPGFGSNMRWLPERGLGIVSFGNRRYAPMSDANRDVFVALQRARRLDVLAPVHALPVSNVLGNAAASLVALVDDWDDDAADRIFEDNVALDESFTRRASAAAKLRADHGRLTLDGIEATSATAATAHLRADDGTELTMTYDLSPLVPPRVQFYEVEIVPSTAADVDVDDASLGGEVGHDDVMVLDGKGVDDERGGHDADQRDTSA